jgi:NitT/TauT family transport system substrate-binding protein
MRRFVWLACAIIIGAVFLGLPEISSSARGQSIAQAVMGDGGVVRMLLNPTGTQVWPVHAMRKYDLPKKYGFDLQTVSIATPQAHATVLQAGGADIGGFGWTDIARMRHAGVKIVGIAPALKWANFIVVPTDSPIQSLGDLRGKRIGTDSRLNMNWIIVRAAALKLHNLKLEEQNTVQEAGMGLLRGLQEQGKLDATIAYNSYMPAMVGSGKVRVLTTIEGLLRQLGPTNTPSMMYAAEGKFAAAKPQNVRAFVAAYREAVEKLRSDDAIWQEHAKDLQITDEKVLALLRDEVRQDVMTTFVPTTEADLKTVFDLVMSIAGPSALGMSSLPDGFMTLDYQ